MLVEAIGPIEGGGKRALKWHCPHQRRTRAACCRRQQLLATPPLAWSRVIPHTSWHSCSSCSAVPPTAVSSAADPCSQPQMQAGDGHRLWQSRPRLLCMRCTGCKSMQAGAPCRCPSSIQARSLPSRHVEEREASPTGALFRDARCLPPLTRSRCLPLVPPPAPQKRPTLGARPARHTHTQCAPAVMGRHEGRWKTGGAPKAAMATSYPLQHCHHTALLTLDRSHSTVARMHSKLLLLTVDASKSGRRVTMVRWLSRRWQDSLQLAQLSTSPG